MNSWLTESKSQLQEDIFEFLWRQWDSLGVAGVSQSDDNRIIDPEALLLFSLSACRYEPRLFDEIIDWLFTNGQFINVQRLQQIQNKYDFKCGPQLSALAGLLSRKSTYKLKWSALAKKYYQEPAMPLFLDKDGIPLPCPRENDANADFLSHGLIRGGINLRGYSRTFDPNITASLLLRLRALLGINARAEILCLLASEKELHPSEAARRTAYYQRTIQTTLVEMSQSGVVSVRTSNKEKYYRLKPGILDALLKPDGRQPKWINWPDLLKAVETLWLKLAALSAMTLDPILLTSELKKLMRAVYENYPNCDIDWVATDANIRIEDFSEKFQQQLRLISDKLLKVSNQMGAETSYK